jgi:hypothetical protein
MKLRVPHIPLLLILLLLAPACAWAGRNAGSSAYLSWDSTGYIPDRPSWSVASVPLYLHVSGTSQVESLYIELRWTRDSTAQTCYGIQSAPIANPCGSAFRQDSLVCFGQDSTVYDGLLPAARLADFCIEYQVSAWLCDSIAGRVALTNAIALDGEGARDTLTIVHDVTINGGPDQGMSLPHIVASTSVLSTGTVQEIVFTSPRLNSQTTPRLVVNSAVLSPLRKTVYGDHIAEAFAIPETPTTLGRVLLSYDDQEAPPDTAESGILIYQRTYASNIVTVRFDSRVVGVSADWTPLETVSFADSSVSAQLHLAGCVALRQMTPIPWDSMIVRNLPNGQRLSIPRASRYYFEALLADTSVAATTATLDSGGISAAPAWQMSEAFDPTDTWYPQQWNLHNVGQFDGEPGVDIDAPSFWDIPVCSICYPTRVELIDTGIDGGHPEFTGRLIEGLKADNQSTSLVDHDGHGTKVAGIIGADMNNGGVAGIYKDAILQSVVWNKDGNKTDADLSNAILWSAYYGGTLANCSVGDISGSGTDQLNAAVRDAYLSGVTLVVATGNENRDHVDYPAGYRGALAVGALFNDGNRWDDYYIQSWGGGNPPTRLEGSNYGAVTVVAPGGEFITTTAPMSSGGYDLVDRPNGKYGFGGTSAAAPVVTGILAKLREKWQLMSPDDAREILERTAINIHDRSGPDQYPSAEPPLNKFDPWTGYGLVNGPLAYDFVEAGNFHDLAATGGAIVDSEDVAIYSQLQHDCAGHSWPWATANARRYRIRATVAASYPWQEPYVAAPIVWAENNRSNGAGTVSKLDAAYYPEVYITGVTADSVTMESNLYKSLSSGAWWPVCPSELVMSAMAYARSQFYVDVPADGAGSHGLMVKGIWRRGSVELRIAGADDICAVSVYDVLGRRVTTERVDNPHGRAVGWTWRGATSAGRARPGVYFVRVASGRQSARCKVVLIY